MGRPSQAAKTKRDRERNRAERNQEKHDKRAQRSELNKQERERLIADGIDPDLAGITPGPQAPSGD
ncbi:MAG: hypothetical protein HY075_05975 [Deltaproteobacteria bacterium]|nr:hypothetical protein [Deltaproteobacteria bacterium]